MADYKLSDEEAAKLLRELDIDEKEQNRQLLKDMYVDIKRTLASKFAAFLIAMFASLLTAGLAIAASAYLIRKALGY